MAIQIECRSKCQIQSVYSTGSKYISRTYRNKRREQFTTIINMRKWRSNFSYIELSKIANSHPFNNSRVNTQTLVSNSRSKILYPWKIYMYTNFLSTIDFFFRWILNLLISNHTERIDRTNKSYQFYTL